jgi:hypothetical protein
MLTENRWKFELLKLFEQNFEQSFLSSPLNYNFVTQKFTIEVYYLCWKFTIEVYYLCWNNSQPKQVMSKKNDMIVK